MLLLVCFKFLGGPDTFLPHTIQKDIFRPGSFLEHLDEPKMNQFLSYNQQESSCGNMTKEIFKIVLPQEGSPRVWGLPFSNPFCFH